MSRGAQGGILGGPQTELLALRTQDEVAQLLGITRGAVSMAERSALKKLRRICILRGLTPEVLR